MRQMSDSRASAEGSADPRVRRTILAIEEAALALLEAEGWDELTAARLCRDAGVARSTFYLHYESTSIPNRSSRAQHDALRKLSRETIDAELTAAYLAGATIGSSRAWVFSEPREPAIAMAYWFSRMAAPGLLDVMGLRDLLDD